MRDHLESLTRQHGSTGGPGEVRLHRASDQLETVFGSLDLDDEDDVADDVIDAIRATDRALWARHGDELRRRS